MFIFHFIYLPFIDISVDNPLTPFCFLFFFLLVKCWNALNFLELTQRKFFKIFLFALKSLTMKMRLMVNILKYKFLYFMWRDAAKNAPDHPKCSTKEQLYLRYICQSKFNFFLCNMNLVRICIWYAKCYWFHVT